MMGNGTNEKPASFPSDRACRTLAFLFTDIEGSTQHWERNPLLMRTALFRHDAVLRSAIENHGGRVFKTAGDAFYGVFDEASAAIGAAEAAQRSLLSDGFPEIGGLRVRMAIDAGEVECREGDFFGVPLNRAARLLGLAQGGQVLVSAVATGLAGRGLPARLTLTDLGFRQLRNVPERLQIFQLQAEGLLKDFSPLPEDGTVPNNLPRLLTRFVGRTEELTSLRNLLDGNPLVSVLGPGGIGKTRTVLELASAVLPSFPEGVWFVDLAPITDPVLIGETLVSVFGLAGGAGLQASDSAIEYLRRKRALVILDNCEHLIAPVAKLAARLLSACPRLNLICTSREPLGVPGETQYRMPSVPFPLNDTAITAEKAQAFEAVRLFVDRARTSVPGFVLTDGNAAAVASICRRLDGLPLALELAASRLRMLQPHELARRLDDRFGILTGGSRTVLLRQQTLKDLIDWSYQLLEPTERLFFSRLSVFGGGFSLDGATAVCAGAPIDEQDAFELLASLVDKSLIIPAASSLQDQGKTRFSFLESTRQFAALKLAESGEYPETMQKLVLWLRGYLKDAERTWSTSNVDLWVQFHQPELDNLRAALDWSFGSGESPELGLELLAWSHCLFKELALFPELRRRLELAQTESRSGISTPVLARLRFALIHCSGNYNNPSMAPKAEEAATLLSQAGEDYLALVATMIQASLLLTPANPSRAEPLLRETTRKLRSWGNTIHLTFCLQQCASARYWQGDIEGARLLLNEAIGISKAMNDPRGSRRFHTGLAEVEFGDGQLQKALDLALATWEEAKTANDQGSLCTLSGNIASYLMAGKLDTDVRPYLRLALGNSIALGREMHAYNDLERTALYLAGSGRFEPAARLYGFVQAWAEARGFAREHTEQVGHEALQHRLEQSLSPAEREELYLQGRLLDLPGAANLALKEIDDQEHEPRPC